jgi:histidinol-phosphatase (PHP family)
MRVSSLHTHTRFCDGQDDIETYCRAAWEKGFASIGFSAHAPIAQKTGLPTDWHLPEARLGEYLGAVREARRRWEGKLPVYLGLEVDYIRGLMGPADRDYRELGLDYVIGSVHYVFPPDGGEPVTVDCSGEEFEANIRDRFDGQGEGVMAAYWDALGEMIRAGGFDILGHLDLVKKNNPEGRWFSETAPAYLDRARGLMEPIARSGAVVEVNTGGLNRGSTREPYPSLPLLRMLRENQVPVTLSSDAHRAAHLDGHYDLARETLIAAGYTETMLFERRREGKSLWSGEPLD